MLLPTATGPILDGPALDELHIELCTITAGLAAGDRASAQAGARRRQRELVSLLTCHRLDELAGMLEREARRFAAGRRAGSGHLMHESDLVQEGVCIVMGAMPCFDPRRGRIEPYMHPWVRHGLAERLRAQYPGLSRREFRDRKAVLVAEEELWRDARPVTIAALAERTGLRPSRVERIRTARQPISLELTALGSGENDGTRTLEAGGAARDVAWTTCEDDDDAWRLDAFEREVADVFEHELTAEERTLLKHRARLTPRRRGRDGRTFHLWWYGDDDTERRDSLRMLALDEYGISPQALHRRAANAARRAEELITERFEGRPEYTELCREYCIGLGGLGGPDASSAA